MVDTAPPNSSRAVHSGSRERKKERKKSKSWAIRADRILAEKAATRVPKGEMIVLVANHDAMKSVEWSNVICEKGEC